MSTLATGPVHSRPGKALLHAGPRGHSEWLLLLCPSWPCGFSQCLRALVQDVSRNGRVSGFHMSPASWGFRWSLLHVFYLLFLLLYFLFCLPSPLLPPCPHLLLPRGGLLLASQMRRQDSERTERPSRKERNQQFGPVTCWALGRRHLT